MNRRLLRFVALALVVLATVAALSWFHILPGGWMLRNFIEQPSHRSERIRLEHREERLQEFAAQESVNRPIVFVGSSTIEYWPLQKTWPDRPMLNRGIGSEAIEELYERLADPRTSLTKASAIVLYSGAVDFYSLKRTPQRITELYEQLLARLGALTGQAGPRIAILGILPSRDLTGLQYRQLVNLNARLFSLAKMRSLKFIDPLKPPLLNAQRQLSAEHSRDRNHLNAKGYAVLSAWLQATGLF